MSTPIVDSVPDAVTAFRSGRPVLVHDANDREGETDIILPASSVEPADIARLRNDAGGLVCVALSASVADAFALPFVQDVLDHPAAEEHNLTYDDRSSFSITVNHRDTHTGVTDRDRAHTIAALGRAAADPETFPFAETFRAPGHVHLLRGAAGLLSGRQGHTELGLALAEKAELPPAVVVCEMLDDETGEALDPASAREYGRRNGMPYLEGAMMIDGVV